MAAPVAPTADTGGPGTDPPTAPRSGAVRWIVGAAVALLYLPAMASVGLRTDVGAHLRFAETMNTTGREFGPYFLFEQATIAVRALIPFGALSELVPALGERSTTWDVAGLVVLMLFVAALAVIVYDRLADAVTAAAPRAAVPVAAAATVVALTVAPVTIFTWSRQQLLLGYVSLTSYENPTVIVARPLGLALFWVLMDRLGRRNPARVVLAVAALSLVAQHAKPSYSVVLLPAMVLYALWSRWRREPIDLRLLGLGFVAPTVAGLGFQAVRSAGQGGIAVAPLRIIRQILEAQGLGLWAFLPLLVMSALFPLVVAVAYRREALASRSWVMSWVTFGVGLALYCTFTVTGRRDYGDFVWGAQIALFVVFMESLRLVLPILAGAWTGAGSAAPTGATGPPPAPRWRGLDVRAWLVLAALALHVVGGAMLYYREIVDPAAWW